MLAPPLVRTPFCVLAGLASMLFLGAATAPSERRELVAEPPCDREFRESTLPLLVRHCAACHQSDRAKGGFDLSRISDGAAVRDAASRWRSVITQIRTGAMPPRVQGGPTEAEREQICRSIADVLAWRDPEAPLDPGVVTLRRLDRFEYDRTVRDLLGVTYDSTRTFPAEATAYGFDNLGDVAFLTPLLVEKYFDAAQDILDRLYRDPVACARALGLAPHCPDEAQFAVEAAVEGLVRRFFRRAATSDDVSGRIAVARRGLADGVSFHEALRPVVASLLLSPHFLFRVEEERDSDRPWALGGFELATRLSYFLWSTTPDARLLDLAESGTLSHASVLESEAERMLANSRSRALADHFGAAWLGFRDVLTHAVDFRRFPGFGDDVKQSLYEESALVFHHLVTQDVPLSTLLDADFTFADPVVARHYGFPNLEGPGFRRISQPDVRRRGVLGMGSILAVTSYPLRTSPVLRGKWVMEALLGIEPPPPPANAGVLPKDDVQPDGLTLRERLALHRKDARCASCHAKMDAFGLALELFDGVGKLRSESHGKPLDATAELPDGTRLDGPEGLRAWLTADPVRFHRAIAERTLVYALGRPVGPTDTPFVQEILTRLEREGPTFRVLVKAIVTSFPFRHARRR